jgi:hypothetical protein
MRLSALPVLPLALGAGLLCAEVQAYSVDGFDYPLGSGTITSSWDGDGYWDAQDWGDSSSYGSYHCGEDWNTEASASHDYGEPVYTIADGLVVAADHYGSEWGNIVMIEHYLAGAGTSDYEYMTSVYAHLSIMDVGVGDWVARGDLIGAIGDADGEYSPHLHFELRWDETLTPTETRAYGCYDETSSGTTDPSAFIDGHRTWSSNGDWAFCSVDSVCFDGQGDCDSDAECDSGLSCAQDVGASIGVSSAVDVCQSAGPVNGDYDFCSTSSPCSEGEGDCDSDAECVSGTECVHDVGAGYGHASNVDMCEAVGPVNGDYDFCSTSSPCSEGEGDCDSDAECVSGTECVHDVGAGYGHASNVDMCEASGSVPGDWDFCSSASPCGSGEGDCDSDAQCSGSLQCVSNVGADYGWDWRVDVCE